MDYILKKDLKIGAKYLGKCRNSDEAVWNGTFFIYYRNKFGYRFEESILHPDDFNGFDVFYPKEIIDEGIVKKEDLKIGNSYTSIYEKVSYTWDGRFFNRLSINVYGKNKIIKSIHPEDNKKYNGKFAIFYPSKFIFENF